MKIVKRGLAVCLIMVLASALSILTTAFVVNTYIQSVLASFDIKLEGPEPGIGGFMKSLTGMNSKAGPEQAEKPKVTAPGDQEKDASGADGTVSTDTNSSGEKAGEEDAPKDALPVMGEASINEEQSGSALDQELVMTPDAMKDLKNNLPADEKANIFNILMAKLPQEEMQKISKAMEDGLTESEVKDLQQVIAKYVDQEEYDTLMKMLTPETADPSQN
ncbi:hypothetical protein [Paenibacillus jilunlii]|uniref:Uncharacterized protein n=1 Tax=Paenibacillus jilunlii TaxID=682956 RepID=A0A1G9THH8_9BACL|nr:hypothetical protein [Paenibacillus jilunlii]KWX71996.1 hypothetical protein AML91_22960 [Paenibacillus jilunlii]SDM46998.1 hypothetical protein SAMN05216191_11345 [Paenibacillus jilunlii]